MQGPPEFCHQAPHVDCVIDGYAIPAGKQTTHYLYIIIAFALFVFLSLSPAGAVKVTSSAGTKWILPEQVPDVLRKRSWLHEIEFFVQLQHGLVAPHGRVQGSEPLEPAPTPALPAGPSSPAPTGKEARWGDFSYGHCPALYL